MASKLMKTNDHNDKFWEQEMCEVEDQMSTEASPNAPHLSYSFDNLLKDNKGNIKEKDTKRLSFKLSCDSTIKFIKINRSHGSHKIVTPDHTDLLIEESCEEIIEIPEKAEFDFCHKKTTSPDERKQMMKKRNRLSSRCILASIV